MKLKGKQLIFISRINRSGLSLEILTEQPANERQTIFNLTCLSITNKTYIANEFNSYVVKIKE